MEDPYFIFIDDGTTISGLTEEGKKQTVLVIPERAKSLEGLTLSDSAVEEVSFTSDHDIGLGTTFTVAKNIKKVTLPAELSVISFAAFGGCDGIESITIPAGVTKIDEYAFDCCSNLKEVIFEGNSCKSIEAYAFESCGIEEIVLPEGLETIGKWAFFDNDALVTVTIPSTVKVIKAEAFNSENLSEAHFAADTEDISIDETAFGARAQDMTVYIAEDSWMDKNRDEWDVGFGTIAYE